MTDRTIELILTAIEGQRRGLPLPFDVLERVYGRETACWYVLRQRVTDDAALESAYTAIRDGQPERVRVIVSVVAGGET
jgi:hypothetical protein